AHVVVVKAEVDIETSIMVVVRDCRMCEASLWRLRKFECVALERVFSVGLIQEEQRTVVADDDQVLHSLVVEVGKQSTGGVIEHAASGFLSYGFECPTSAILIETVG